MRKNTAGSMGPAALAAVIGFAALSGTPVLAADMALKAEAPAPVYNWTGCYVGVNGGYGWNNGRSSYNDTNTTADPINFIPNPADRFPIAHLPTPSGTGGSGGLVGGSGGCNYQIQQWVIGIEADGDWAHISGSSNISAQALPPTPPGGQFQVGPGVFSGVGVFGAASEQVTLQWFSTIRARGGMLVSDRLLLFATGGLALGGINSQGSVTVFRGTSTSSPPDVIWNGSTTPTRVGGVVGAGLEWAALGPLTVKAEYLFYTFGSVTHPLNCSYPNPCDELYPTLGSTNASVFGSIVRVGVNYRFW
jgi:outer membrane immunogenic protein